MRIIALVLVLFCLNSVSAQSVEDLSFETAEGQEVKLSQYAMAVTLLVFISNDCPYAKYYMERIETLSRKYSGRAGVILINSDISEFGKGNPFEKGGAVYLYDRNQIAAKLLKAKRAPEAFILKREGSKYNVLYSGAIDDSPQLASDVQESYVVDVLDALLAGKEGPFQSTRPTGCMIRYN